MAMTVEERAAHCRRISTLGGQAVVRVRGREHMARIGQAGFKAALDLGYGKYLAETVLRTSYRAKFGRDPQYTRNKAGDAARAKARREKPDKGPCQWPACAASATDLHHVDGWQQSDDTTSLCADHHDAFEAAYRAARKRYRPHSQDPVTRRAVAISIGIGLDDGVPF